MGKRLEETERILRKLRKRRSDRLPSDPPGLQLRSELLPVDREDFFPDET